ncbi:MAG: hypothetical protein PF541_01005 [Prolixibacteraceae bacterium]|jgi:hypothetical protein|nr:hypothetical protein [Prolixibacteraceae bacterium]
MKNLIILISILIASTLISKAGNYEETLGMNISKMYQTQDANELIAISNTFERIGEKEQTKWLPFYYSAYSNISILFYTREIPVREKIAYLNQAQEKLNKAKKITNQESELYVLQALIYQMSITDPSLGQKYSSLAYEALAKAELLNRNNPRCYYLKALNIYNTPVEYGGGKSVAKPLFEKASALFESNTGEDPLHPNWGKQHNSMLLEQCN